MFEDCDAFGGGHDDKGDVNDLFIDDHYYDDDDFDDNLNDCTIAPLAPAVLMDCGFEEVAFPESVTRKQIF